MSPLRSQLSLAIVYGVAVLLLAAAFAVTVIWPQLLLATIITGCFALVLTMVGTTKILSRKWVLWLVVPALALTGLGAMMLAEDLGVSRLGEPTDVVVVEHTRDVKTVHDSNDPDGRKVYTHTYRLEHVHGSPIDQPMVYRGKDGYDDVDEGDTITVLIDPAGGAPIEPAESIDIGADIAVLVVGIILAAGVYIICVLLLVKDAVRPRRPAAAAPPWMIH